MTARQVGYATAGSVCVATLPANVNFLARDWTLISALGTLAGLAVAADLFFNWKKVMS